MTREEKIIEAYKSGLGVRKVAKMFRAGKSHIHRIVQRAGVVRNGHPNPYRRVPDISDLLILRDAGVRLVDAAKEFGVNEESISIHMRAAGEIWGLQPDSLIKRHDIDTDEIAAMYRGGWTMPEIAKELGCALRTVGLRLKKAGVPSRSKGERNRVKTYVRG